jgi:hypothetical protein
LFSPPLEKQKATAAVAAKTVSKAAVSSIEKQKARRAKEKTRQDKQKSFVALTILKEVVYDETKPIQVCSRSNTETTEVQSIKDRHTTQLSIYCLKAFCAKHQINGYKDKTKDKLCNLIVTKAKLNNLDLHMNPEDHVDGTEEETEEQFDKQNVGQQKTKKIKNSLKPKSSTKDGTIYRVVLNNFLQSL